jgi:hypothetical protein
MFSPIPAPLVIAYKTAPVHTTSPTLWIQREFPPTSLMRSPLKETRMAILTGRHERMRRGRIGAEEQGRIEGVGLMQRWTDIISGEVIQSVTDKILLLVRNHHADARSSTQESAPGPTHIVGSRNHTRTLLVHIGGARNANAMLGL